MYLGQIVEIGTKQQVLNAPAPSLLEGLAFLRTFFPDLSHRRVERKER